MSEENTARKRVKVQEMQVVLISQEPRMRKQSSKREQDLNGTNWVDLVMWWKLWMDAGFTSSIVGWLRLACVWYVFGLLCIAIMVVKWDANFAN